ncbi:hypothetical protein PYCCODRAFT_623803 [Trametes coccinea BRFM310]|uniref:Uncharacterized protein n=1 Tax=Trametes coccinea (strain BRFM310) TaxID=1353009 RepID=A0A1Y2J2D8_TRAC3|nr:hypothetical protein PYCCODRAFT_623803 [Trametes coccinea BRFM310]
MSSSPVLRMSAAVLIAAYTWTGCYAAAIIDPTKSPSIIRPNGADVWTVGSVQTIRWSNAGLDITNEQGRVVLGYNDPVTGRTNEYLVQPLADGFRLADEVVNIVTPEVPSGDFYYIVLLGNADNASPIFSIINPTSPQENIQNVTFPTLLSIGSAPPATVSHSSSSTLTSPASSSSSQPASVSSLLPNSSGTSGACRQSKTGVLSWLLMIVLGLSVSMIL